jgi:hypothetical protein
MKTVREWLNEFPVEIRDMAIRNAEASDWNAMDNQEQDTANALAGAFNWHDTPEKDEFWNAWYEWLQDPSQPKPTIQPADGSVVVGDHSGDVNEKIERMRFEAASMYMAALAAQPGSPSHKAELSVAAADALIAELKKPKP